MEKTINTWLETLSTSLKQGKWKLDNYQCCLEDNTGMPYLTMEWLPTESLLLFAFPLGNLQSEGLDAEEKMFELLSLNAHPDLIGKAWLALGEGGKDYYLMSAIDIESYTYAKFETHWQEINQLSKIIQFAIKPDVNVMTEKLPTEMVRV